MKGHVWWPTLLLCFLGTAAAGPAESDFNHFAADPGHKMTGKEFFRELLSTYPAFLARGSLPAVVGGGAAYALATIPEQRLEKHFQRGDIWGAWSTPGKYIGNPLVLGGAGASLFALSRHSDDRRFRSFGFAVLEGSLISSSIVMPAKELTGRLRPSGENYHAFPSGHATDSFMWATIVQEHYGLKAGIPSFLVAAYVSATRLEERKHHLTDVVAGAAIGYLTGHTISRRMRRRQSDTLTYHVLPVRGGLLLSVRIVK